MSELSKVMYRQAVFYIGKFDLINTKLWFEKAKHIDALILEKSLDETVYNQNYIISTIIMCINEGNNNMINELFEYLKRDKMKLFINLESIYTKKKRNNENIPENLIEYLNSIDLFIRVRTIPKIFPKVKNEYYGEEDFIIICCEKEYKVHKNLLNSRFFIYLLNGKFQDTDRLTINSYDVKHVEMMLEYFYTNRIKNIKEEDIDEMMRLADEYAIDNLYDMLLRLKLIFTNY